MISKNGENLICVRVITHAHVDQVVGWTDGVLRVRLRAKAEKGRANIALIELLADHFSVAKSKIEIVSGTRERNKRIQLPKEASLPEVK